MPNDQYYDEQSLIFRPLTGGMVSSMPVQELQIGEFKVLNNAIFYKNRWRKRPGVKPIWDSSPSADEGSTSLLGPAIGIFRLQRSDGYIYSVVIDFESVNGVANRCRLIARELASGVGEIATAVDWTEIDGDYEVYANNVAPHFWSGVEMMERLILTDGLVSPRYFKGLDTNRTTWLKGNLGAFPPRRQLGIPTAFEAGWNQLTPATWGDNPIAPSGYFQYCYRYVYQDKNGQASYSNPSPRSPIIPLDWFGKFPDGALPNEEALGNEQIATDPDVGPVSIGISQLGIGDEFMANNVDVEAVRRIVRREVFRRRKTYSDNIFSAWEKVADVPLVDGVGVQFYVDKTSEAIPMTLDVDLQTPPIAQYVALHKERAVLSNIAGRTLPSPFNQSDTSYPKYELLGLVKRARVAITNNTPHGITDATVRLKLQWHTSTDPDYIDFDDTKGDGTDGAAGARTNIVFVDDDGVTILKFYRESYTVASNQAIFLVNIPEIGARATTYIYVYYDTSTGIISDKSLAINAVCHRRYLATDIMDIVNFDNGYPLFLPQGNGQGNVVSRRLAHPTVWGVSGYGGASRVFCGNTANYLTGNSINATGDVDRVDTQFDLFDPKWGMNQQGCIQGFFYTGPDVPANDGYLFQGGGVTVYLSIAGGTDHLVVMMGGGDNYVSLALSNGGNVAQNSYYFVSIGWDSSSATNVHVYLRELLAAPAALDLASGASAANLVTEITKFVGKVAGGVDFGREAAFGIGIANVANPDNAYHTLRQYFSDLVLRKYCPSLEEVESHFLCQDLDTYFYDVLTHPARGGAGWNLTGATATISVKNHESVATDNPRAGSIAISERANPDVYKSANTFAIASDADPIMAPVTEVGDSLLVFKRNSIYRLRTDGHISQWRQESNVVQLSKSTGLIAPRSLKVVKSGGATIAIGLSESGVFATDGIRVFDWLSNDISDFIDTLSAEMKANAVGGYFSKQGRSLYIIAFGTDLPTGGGLPSGTTVRVYPASKVGGHAYAFHLDSLDVGRRKINISKLSSYQIGNSRYRNDGVPFVLTGSIDTTASVNVVGVNTLFTTELASGDQITVSGETRIVDVITDNTHLTVTVAFPDLVNDTSPEGCKGIPRFQMGIGMNWDGPNDKGEMVFCHPSLPYIYTFGERGVGNVKEFQDKWGSTDINIPFYFETFAPRFRNAVFSAFKFWYKAKDLVSSALADVRNKLSITPVTYDEAESSANLNATTPVALTETTHTAQTGVVSGGQNGLPNTLPETAKGEYIYFKGEELTCEGEIELDGFELQHHEVDTA